MSGITPPFSRRGLLCGLGTPALLVSDARLPDPSLIEAGRALDALWDQERALLERYEWDAPEVVAIETRCDVIVRQITAATATTLDGLIVKARACSYCQCGEPFTAETFAAASVGSDRLAGTLIRDLLAINGAGARQ